MIFSTLALYSSAVIAMPAGDHHNPGMQINPETCEDDGIPIAQSSAYSKQEKSIHILKKTLCRMGASDFNSDHNPGSAIDPKTCLSDGLAIAQASAYDEADIAAYIQEKILCRMKKAKFNKTK
jgi:hypothetical protein